MPLIIWNQDPILFRLGAISVHWYGLFFATGLVIGLWMMKKIFIHEKRDLSILDPLFIYIVIGIVIGARLAHCLFYEPSYYIENPLEIFAIWHGGLASHGGIAGAVAATWIFCRKKGVEFLWIFSRLMIPALLLASFIRVGNLFNSEILGRATGGDWGFVFVRIDTIPRHPVMIYESAGYFLLFVLILFLYTKLSEKEFTRFVPGIALTGIFAIRIILEEFKTKQTDFMIDLPISMGQILSIPFLLAGLYLLGHAILYKNRDSTQ